MTICKFYAQGYCKFGSNCRFEHTKQSRGGETFYGSNRFGTLQSNAKQTGNKNPEDLTPEDLIDIIKDEMNTWEKSKMWPLSCYGYKKSGPCLSGFEDYSPEELRHEAYLVLKQGPGAISDHKQKLQSVAAQYKSKRDDYRMMLPAVKTATLEEIKRSMTSSSPGGIIRQGSFGSGSFGSTNKSNPFTNLGSSNTTSFCATSAVVGGSAFASPIASKAPTFGASPSFGGASSFGAKPAFGTSSSTNSFGALASTSNHSTNVFGSQSNATGNAFAALATNSNAFGADSIKDQNNTFGNAANSTSFGLASNVTKPLFGSSSSTTRTSAATQASAFGAAPVFGANPIATAAFGASPFGANTANSAVATTSSSTISSTSNSLFATSTTQTTKVMFGKTITVTESVPVTNTTAQDDDTIYSKMEELTVEEIAQFRADSFILGKIPNKPPPKDLCT